MRKYAVALVLLLVASACGSGSDEDSTGSPPSTTVCEDTAYNSGAQRPRDRVQVFVANGSGVPRRATAVSEILEAEGYRVSKPGNADPAETSKVYYHPSYAADARGIQSLIFPCRVELIMPMPYPDIEFVPDSAVSRVRDANVVITLGSDMAGDDSGRTP